MSHFIMQSTKIAKITDGTQTLVILGYTGKDNNVEYGAHHRTSVDFYLCRKTQQEIEQLRAEVAYTVLGGSMQLKDMYRQSLKEQAPVAVRRLDSALKNAKTYQVDKIHEDGSIEWGNAQWEITRDVKLPCRFSKQLQYTPIAAERLHALDKAAADFVKAPSSDPERIGAVVERMSYAVGYLDPQVRLTERQFCDLLSKGSDWNVQLPLEQYAGIVTSPADAVALAEGPFFRYGGTAAALIQCLSPKLQDDPQVAAQMLHANAWLYPHMTHPNVRQNEALGRVACQLETANYAHAPLAVRADKQVALHCLKARARELIQTVPEHLLYDPEIITTAVKSSASVMQHLPEDLRSDIRVVHAAMRDYNQQEVLSYTSTGLRQQITALVHSGAHLSALSAVEELAAQASAQRLAKQDARVPSKVLPAGPGAPARPQMDRAL